MILYFKKFFIALIIFSFLSSFAASKPESLGDRLILEVGKNTYTQRQLELHLVIKSIIQNQQFNPISPSNWLQSLNEFSEDMVIFLASQEIGRFQPQNKKVQIETQRFYDLASKSSQLKSFMERMDVKKVNILENVSKILQIEDYKKLKVKDTTWKSNLSNIYNLRFFEESKKYIEIHPS